MHVGFIGLGKMGAPMAHRLLDQGHKLTVYDIRSSAVKPLVKLGAIAARSPREVASKAAIVCSSLPSREAACAVTQGKDGVCQGKRISTYIDFSTTGPALARELAASFTKHGIKMIEAPVTGGVDGAKKGALSIILGGNRQAIKSAKPILDALGKVFYIGKIAGQAQSMKLINNILSASALAITSEAFVLGAKAGLSPEMMLRIINCSSGRNSATVDKFPRQVITRRFKAGADIAIFEKDVRLCLEEAAHLGVTMWVGTAVYQLWAHASRLGGAKKDITELVKYLEDWAGGVQVAGKYS